MSQTKNMSRVEAIERAKQMQHKYRRNTTIVEFTDEARQCSRYRVYFTSEQHRALKDCRVGESFGLVGRVIKDRGYVSHDVPHVSITQKTETEQEQQPQQP